MPRSPFRSKWQASIPAKKAVRFKYSDTGFNGSTAIGGAYQSVYVFSGNSPYDPDATGVGVQPYGYDQSLSAYHYAWYTCPASKIKVYPHTVDLATSIPCIRLTVVPSQATALSFTDASDVIESRGARTRQFNYDDQISKTVSNYCSTRQMYPGQTWRDVNFRAAYSQNPTSRWYWLVIFDTSNFAYETNIQYDVKITYYTICESNRNINES